MSRSRPLHLFTFVLFVGVLIGPWIAGLFGATADTVERRLPAALPELGGDALLEVNTFAGINDYVRDRTPLRGDATGWINGFWLQFGAAADTAVVEGPDEYFFLAEDFTRPCDRGYELDDMVGQFANYSEAAAAGDKDLLFLVASDKGAVLDHQLDGRSLIAANCSRLARPEFRTALDSTGLSFDLAPSLIAAVRANDEPGRWYYEHDSHWTFEAGGIVAGDIVEHFDDELYDPQVIRRLDRGLPINGDIYRRMGIVRTLEEPDRVRVSERPNVVSDLDEQNIDGTRTIRTYANTGDSEFIEGTTIIVHDSMMNFVELQLAPYFEEAVFIHWDDLERADFFARVEAADNLILARVERDVHRTMVSHMLDADFSASLNDALAVPAPQPEPEPVANPDLGLELQQGAGALRAFTRDTGGFATSFADLVTDPGIEGWLGPYLQGAPFENVHPLYGEWSVLFDPEPLAGSLADCSDYDPGTCASWIVLADVPLAEFESLDTEFDVADGDAAGRVRYDADTSTVFFYSLA